MAIFIVLKEFHQTLTIKIPLIQEKFMIVDYPLSFISSVINKFQNGKDHGDEILINPYFVWNYKTFYIH